MKKTGLSLLFILIGISVIGDDHIVYNLHTDAVEIMGQKQPANDVEIHQWFNQKYAAVNMPGRRSVVDADKSMCYIIFEDQKAYLKMPMPVQVTDYLPPQVAQYLSAQKIVVRVTELDETKDILGVKCKTYLASFDMGMTKIDMKFYVSEDVPFDYSTYRDKFEEPMLRLTKENLDDAAFEELKKMKGFQMGYEMTADMMGTKVVSRYEAVKITNEDAPVGTYLPPKNYKKLEQFPMPTPPAIPSQD
ncbi:MAG: hypothetical protein CSA81_01265 [Acidobacteria bacterium]|nr:MAG: hypothetical protein CSA81_01265 [Acidobacteriota bacterium]